MKRILLPKVSDSKEINLDNVSVQNGIVAIDDSGALPFAMVTSKASLGIFGLTYYNGDISSVTFTSLETLMTHYERKGYKFYQL